MSLIYSLRVKIISQIFQSDQSTPLGQENAFPQTKRVQNFVFIVHNPSVRFPRKHFVTIYRLFIVRSALYVLNVRIRCTTRTIDCMMAMAAAITWLTPNNFMSFYDLRNFQWLYVCVLWVKLIFINIGHPQPTTNERNPFGRWKLWEHLRAIRFPDTELLSTDCVEKRGYVPRILHRHKRR